MKLYENGEEMSSVKNGIRISIYVLVLLILAACSSNNQITSEPIDQQVSDTTLSSEYRIGIDDRVQVSVWRNPELSVTVPVRPDGKISVPLAGDIQAGGLTSIEVAKAIQEKLAVYVRDPQVTVIVAELKSHEFLTRVRVTGAVRAPSSMPYRQGMTVLDAVLQAGGLNQFAAPDRTMLYRKKDSKVKIYSIQLDGILKKGELETNFDVQPGDVITVPERFF
jgi:polysaccharide export outer membrane protein